PEEAELRALWLIWKAKVLKDESRFSEAGEVLSQVEAFVTWESDWYGYFCARVIRASLLLAMDRVAEADEVVREVRELFGKRQFKPLKMQLDDLERRVREKSDLGVLQYVPEGEGIRYVYENRVLTLKKESPAERLLRALI